VLQHDHCREVQLRHILGPDLNLDLSRLAPLPLPLGLGVVEGPALLLPKCLSPPLVPFSLLVLVRGAPERYDLGLLFQVGLQQPVFIFYFLFLFILFLILFLFGGCRNREIRRRQQPRG
jgi:hypothetical protein